MEQPSPTISTRNVGIRYGLLLSIVSVLFFLLASSLGFSSTDGPGKWAVYIFFGVMLFLAHKYFKDNGNGFMSYGQGMTIAFWTTLISSAISSVFTYLYIKFMDPSWMQKMKEMQMEELEKQNMSDEEMEFAAKIMENLSSPEAILFFALLGGIMAGVIIGLIVTIFTQKKNSEPVF